MGWLLVGKRYSSRQIASVALLTVGVVLATWSNAHNQVNNVWYSVLIIIEKGRCGTI
jgi:drug/metabolite transporter (DMT)-like permease